MSGNKWKIYQHGQFLGHWCTTTAEKAIEKMLNSLYAKAYSVDPDDWFDAYKGSYHIQILMRPYEICPEP